MRLWHYKLLPYLPNQQLVSQWRELSSIFSSQNRYILINYVYDHPKEYLKHYSKLVLDEFKNRGYKVRSFDAYNKYFEGIEDSEVNFPEHNYRYLRQNFYNLQEKFDRNQKGFDKALQERLEEMFIKETFQQDPNDFIILGVDLAIEKDKGVNYDL